MIRLSGLLPMVVAALVASPAAARPVLQPTVTVQAPVVRLGDIFMDAGTQANDPVAAAPAPGQKATYDSNWLIGVAKEHGLDWQPGSRLEVVTVERASQSISSDAIADRLLQEIGNLQPVDNAQVQLDSVGTRLFAPAGAVPTLTVDGLNFDARSGRFSAYVATGEGTTQRSRVNGRLFYTTQVPVLSRSVLPGETISQADISYIALRNDRLGQGLVVDTQGLVGKTPRRPIQAMQPVRPSDLQIPVVIKKGDLVTVTLVTPALSLTTQGKALDDGGLGAAIRVSNTRSNRIIDVTVTGPNLAMVGGAPQSVVR